MPLYTAFVDLTKVFDLVNRDGLFKFLPKIGCPPKLQSMIESFHSDSKGTVQFNVSPSEPLEIRIGVKQGCVLAATLFGIFFGMLLNMPSTQQQKGSTFVLAQMACSSTSPVSEPRQRYARFSSGTCCLLVACSCDPHPGGTTVIDGLLLTCL